MEMKAALYHGAGDIRFGYVPIPTPGRGEVLIKVTANGICGTDAHEYHAGPHMFPDTGFVPGHEFAGHVVEVGFDVDGLNENDLVACGAGISCGRCSWCLRGRTSVCERYTTLGLQQPGALAQYVVAPADICLEVGSYGLSQDVAALTQPMSIAVHSMRRGGPEKGDNVVVVGAGGIGAFLTYALVEEGARVTVIDRDERRLELARGLGASLAMGLDAFEDQETRNETIGIPTIIYEATGSASGLALTWDLAAPATRVVLIGLQSGASHLDLRRLSLKEIELIGTNAHAFSSDFADAAALLGSRTVGWADVAPTVFPLEDLVEHGLKPMIDGRPAAVKTLIDPWIEAQRPLR